MSSKRQTPKPNQKKSKIVHKKSAASAPKTRASLGKVATRQKQRVSKPTLLQFMVQLLYKQLYMLGVTILRRKLRYKRRIKHGFALVKGFVYASTDRIGSVLSNFIKSFISRIKAPFQRISAIKAETKPLIAAAKAKGKSPLRYYGRIIVSTVQMFSTVITTIFNYVAPVLAAMLLISVVRMYTGQPLALAVEYNGEIIGYVKNEVDFDNAAQILKDRFIDGNTSVENAKFTLITVSPSEYEETESFIRRFFFLERLDTEYATPDELADKMVQASGDTIELAFGLYVNNQFYGAVTERGLITGELNAIRDANSTGLPDERVDFIKKISVREGLYPMDSIISPTEMMQIIHDDEEVAQTYVVELGDSPSLIADKNGITYSQLLEYNPELENSGLYVGQEVNIAMARPFLSVKNTYTIVYEEEYEYEIEEIESATYSKNYRNVLEAGQNGVWEVTADVTAINGIETERTILETRVVREAVTEKVMVGTMDPQQNPVNNDTGSAGGVIPPDSPQVSAGFIWPTSGGYINGGLGSYPGHTGVDIPNPAGTPIYAARGGVVTTSVRTGVGYGYYVVIDHGDGYQTLYAHASDIYVSAGQRVEQGQTIAAVGRTGRATGNHLHFEVRYQGRIQDPLAYIG